MPLHLVAPSPPLTRTTLTTIMAPPVGLMKLWDHLAFSTNGMQDTAATMIGCWLQPELQRTKLRQAQCQELLLGELLSIAAFTPMLLLSNVLLLPLMVAPLKFLLVGRVTEAKLASSSAFMQWRFFTWVVLQRSFHVRIATMMLQGTEAFNAFLRLIGYKIGRQAWLGNHNMSLVTPELVTVGATASLGSDCHFLNATPLGTGTITIGAGADMGHQTTLFPGTVLAPGSVLGAKSNLFHGETLPAGAIRLVSEQSGLLRLSVGLRGCCLFLNLLLLVSTYALKPLAAS